MGNQSEFRVDRTMKCVLLGFLTFVTLLSGSRGIPQNGRVRSDRRCGQPFADEGFRLPNGALYECDPNSERPCCSKWGWCGGDAEHCACETCVDHRPRNNRPRNDRPRNNEINSGDYIDYGNPDYYDYTGSSGSSSGDIHSNKITKLALQKSANCANLHPSLCFGHCQWDHVSTQCVQGNAILNEFEVVNEFTHNSIDNRVTFSFNGKWRDDRRCGPEFPLPDGSGPTQCNPNSANYCCSIHGWCGPPNPSNPKEDHCINGGVNYRG